MSNLVPVALATELPPGQRKLVFADGKSVVIFNVEGTIYAIENSCPHNGASLASGCLEGTVLRCPAHGLRFNLTTQDGGTSGALRLRRFPVREIGGVLILQTDPDERWSMPRSSDQ
ncbi:Rieske 2Fe-2S domain-containing protein [Paraburkholderia sabiae]|uniref:Rieske 2Fe-2S domain-containing protein n=1 Tax=Paraburkholderia sabiae TaxID=273251 RepID=A0ABU9QS23_9BURK|nr:Rieske 2Fe-2S domain-containing protein [Paraburkholderia sabiae]WJZ77136.1 Rieske 2Fe-2S domain-containing protein [Paraburkholderia sabiae]